MSGPYIFSRRRFLQYTGGFSALSLAASMDKLGLASASAQPGTVLDNTPFWSVNPFAVAELITGDALSSEKEDSAHAQAVLQDAFKTKPEAIFKADGGTDPPFALFQKLARSAGAPPELAKNELSELVEKAIIRYGKSRCGACCRTWCPTPTPYSPSRRRRLHRNTLQLPNTGATSNTKS